MTPLNFKHLHYFWVVAHEGGITRDAERLGVAAQTISGQLSLLERRLGHADRIFELGDAPVSPTVSPNCWPTIC